MSALIKMAFGAASGWIRREFGWIILLGIAIALAAVYVAFRQITADRDKLLVFAEQTCAAAGQPFDESVQRTHDASGKPVARRYKRGQLCAVRIVALDRFERDAEAQTNKALADHQQDQDRKADADIVAARTAAQTAVSAMQKMEKSNARVGKDDRVDGRWFADLNDLGGMRAHD